MASAGGKRMSGKGRSGAGGAATPNGPQPEQGPGSARVLNARAPSARSGTWKITWRGGADPNDAYSEPLHSLFERQLNTFAEPRVFLLGQVPEQDLLHIRARAGLVAMGGTSAAPGALFDVAWDAGLLSRVGLAERLALVQTLDERLRIGGTCIVVVHDHDGLQEPWAHSISPEQIAAYFIPAYVVARHEEHEFALPPGRPVVFHTLALVKHGPLTSEMLDFDFHRSLQAVASQRRRTPR